MHKLFFNLREDRTRAFFRILSFIVFFLLANLIATIISTENWINRLLTAFFVAVFYYVFICYIDKRPWKNGGLYIDSVWLREFLTGLTLAAAVMALIFTVEWVSGDIQINGFIWERREGAGWLRPVAAYLIIMLCVGFYEEVLSRGYLIPNIKEGLTLGKIHAREALFIAVIISSSIFGLAHASNPNSSLMAVVSIVLAGIMLAVPYVITGRLALSIGIHFAWNFFQGGIFGFPVSGMKFPHSLFQIQQSGADWWTGGSFGPEAGLIGVLGILLILGGTLILMKWKKIPLKPDSFLAGKFGKKI